MTAVRKLPDFWSPERGTFEEKRSGSDSLSHQFHADLVLLLAQTLLGASRGQADGDVFHVRGTGREEENKKMKVFQEKKLFPHS